MTLAQISTRIHAEDIPSLNGMIDRARSDGSNFEYDHRLQMPDRTVKYLHVVAHATRDQDDRLEYIGAIQDVTQRRFSEAGTRQSPIGTRARGQGHEPWRLDGVDCARSQPAAIGHHYQRQHVFADAGRRSRQTLTALAKPHGARFAMATVRLM